MTRTASRIADEPASWAMPGTGAVLLTLLVLLLLTLATRQSLPPPVEEQPIALSFESVQIPEQKPSAAAPATAGDLSALLPRPQTPVPPELRVESTPLDIPVDMASMLQMRYSYQDLGSARSVNVAFGMSNLANIDEPVENVIIPPNLFPTSLIDQGIYEGNVIVTLTIDEKGRAKVKTVISASHPELVAPVVDSLSQALFTSPTRDGRPTKVMIRRNVIFKADPERVRRHREGKRP